MKFTLAFCQLLGSQIITCLCLMSEVSGCVFMHGETKQF